MILGNAVGFRGSEDILKCTRNSRPLTGHPFWFTEFSFRVDSIILCDYKAKLVFNTVYWQTIVISLGHVGEQQAQINCTLPVQSTSRAILMRDRWRHGATKTDDFSKQPLPPPSHFWKIMLHFFRKIMLKRYFEYFQQIPIATVWHSMMHSVPCCKNITPHMYVYKKMFEKQFYPKTSCTNFHFLGKYLGKSWS